MDADRIEGEATKLAGKAQTAVGTLVGDEKLQTEGLARQAAGVAQNALGQAKDVAHDLAGRASEQFDQAYDAAGRAVESGRKYFDEGLDRYPASREVIDRGRGTIQQSPLLALLLAGAVGYVLALAFHRRTD